MWQKFIIQIKRMKKITKSYSIQIDLISNLSEPFNDFWNINHSETNHLLKYRTLIISTLCVVDLVHQRSCSLAFLCILDLVHSRSCAFSFLCIIDLAHYRSCAIILCVMDLVSYHRCGLSTLWVIDTIFQISSIWSLTQCKKPQK